MDEPKTLEERKAILAKHVAAAVPFGARIESQSETMAVLVTGKPVNHMLHFLIGFPTLGFWWLVWLFLAITGGEKRQVITVDNYGNILEQGQGGRGGSIDPVEQNAKEQIKKRADQQKAARGCLIGCFGIFALLLVGIAIIAIAANGEDGDTRSAKPNVEDCFSKWDGHLDALEDLVRSYLNDEESMQTHDTRFSRQPDANGYHRVIMEYSAENALGGRIKLQAVGRVRASDCRVILDDPGF